MKTQHTKICGVQQKHFKGYFIAINNYFKKRKISNKHPNFTSKETRKRTN